MANADVFAKMRPPTREKFATMAPGTKNEPMVAMPQVEDQKVVPYTASEMEVEGMDATTPRKVGNPIRAQGSGGYAYDVMPDDSILIVQSRGKAVDPSRATVVTKDSEFYDLIMDDIKKYAGKPAATAAKPATQKPPRVERIDPEVEDAYLASVGKPGVMDMGTTDIAPNVMDFGTTTIPRGVPTAAMAANPQLPQSQVFATMMKLGMEPEAAAVSVRGMDKATLSKTMENLLMKGVLVPASTENDAHYQDVLLNL